MRWGLVMEVGVLSRRGNGKEWLRARWKWKEA
jgi:hypothetical protein